MGAEVFISPTLFFLALGGIFWWGMEIWGLSREEQSEEYFADTPGGEAELDTQQLIDLGTGPMAEEQLASTLASTRQTVFIAGAITRTVYTLVRDYVPWGKGLEILANPKLGGAVQLYDLKTKLAAVVKETDEITAALITIFSIDGEYAYLMRAENNAIVASGNREVAAQLTANARSQWTRARTYR